MTDLKVSLLQSDISWQAPAANRAHYAATLNRLGEATDLIVLPEMFTTGFTMEPAPNAETMEGPTVAWMAAQAAERKAVITGSLIIEEDGKYFNRLIWMKPDGGYHTYDKRHLFTMAGEHEHYAAGTNRLIAELKGWRICPLICYDLRFPVYSRNQDDYDVLIYVANWPARRSYHWRTLLRARAIENQCYTIGVNRVGTDANGHHYRGDSCLIAPGHRQTIFALQEEEGIHTLTLSAEKLADVRRQWPFLADRDYFTLDL